MRSRIFLKLLAVLALVIVTATITLDITVRHSWGRMLREQIERNLVQKAKMLANRVETDRTHNLQDIASQEALAAEARVTIIDPTGKVLADSEADPATMQNHAQRKEFVAALAGNLGKEERRSQTLGVPFIYVAVPVSGGAVRLAACGIRKLKMGSRAGFVLGNGPRIPPRIAIGGHRGKFHGPALAADCYVRGTGRSRRFDGTHWFGLD